jgi:hypothetical protein
MVWIMKRRWWVLAVGLVLLLFGLLLPGPVDGVRGGLGALGFVMTYMAMLAVLRVISVAVRVRRAAHRPSNSH